MENLIKYFDVKYGIKDILNLESTKHDITIKKSLSSSKMLNVFFTVLLEYYFTHNIKIDYSDITVSNEIKNNIIKKVYPIIDMEKSIKLYNLIDFMMMTVKKIVIRAHKGFLKWTEVNLDFYMTLMLYIDLLFYVIFVNVFPEDLRNLLREELKLSDLEYKILIKCSDILIINNEKICNFKKIKKKDINEEKDLRVPLSSLQILKPSFDSIKDKRNFQIKFKNSKDRSYIQTREGAMMLFKLLTDLREFKNRRMSKLDEL
jgi:hypothetical protein